MAKGINRKRYDASGVLLTDEYLSESVADSLDFDVVSQSAPSNKTSAPFGVRVRRPYTPEPVRTFNPQQYPSGLSFHQNFKFNLDYSGGIAMQTLRALGQNAFNQTLLSDSEKAALNYGEGVIYAGESNYHDYLEGSRVYEASLQTYFNVIWNRLPGCGNPGPDQGVKWFIINIETSADLFPGDGPNPYPGFTQGGYYGGGKNASWASSKGIQIVCENTNRTITLEQLANEGPDSWIAEMKVRRANRWCLLMQTIKRKGLQVNGQGVTQVSYGRALYQGLPDLQFRNQATYDLDGNCNVSNIGGDSQGNITLSQPGGGSQSFVLTGSFWALEDFHLDYFYDMGVDISQQDYNDIFVTKLAGTQNYPYLWSKMYPIHTGAMDKAHWQQNRYKMSHCYGLKLIPQWRMAEPVFEGNIAVTVNGTPMAGRIPFDYLQAGPSTGISETPKIMAPPVVNHAHYGWARFLSGGIPNSGYRHFFLDGVIDKKDPATVPQLNHHLHCYTAMWQCRMDLHPEEAFLEASTLIEDPEVKLLGQGDWRAYDGMQAYNVDAGNYHMVNGVYGTGFLPAYSLRSLVLPNGDTQYLLAGQLAQPRGTERTDLVRVPGGAGMNGCVLQVKLRGDGLHIYKFLVRQSDANLTIPAIPVVVPSRELYGYGGWTNPLS